MTTDRRRVSVFFIGQAVPPPHMERHQYVSISSGTAARRTFEPNSSRAASPGKVPGYKITFSRRWGASPYVRVAGTAPTAGQSARRNAVIASDA